MSKYNYNKNEILNIAFEAWFLEKLSTTAGGVKGLLALVLAVIAAANTIRTGKTEISQLQVKVDVMFSKLAPALAFVPPDYRYSAAVEHFCEEA